jgi:ABC-type multidrug transport system ATPase subunit
MAKRVALAQAFLGNPEVVCLDEPTSGLDPATAAIIRNLIRKMAGSRTVIISSHNLLEIQDMCSHCAILDKGRLVASGTLDQLLGAGSHVRITLDRPAALNLPESIATVTGVVTAKLVEAAVLEIDYRSPSDDRAAVLRDIIQAILAAGYVPFEMTPGRSLELRFLQMTGLSSDGLGGT